MSRDADHILRLEDAQAELEEMMQQDEVLELG